MTPNADTRETTDRNGDPICKCGATTFTFKNGRKRCAKGHTLVANKDAAITGHHSIHWRREHEAEIQAMAQRLVLDAGYRAFDAAPLSLQIVARAVARTTKVADTAYWRMMEVGGPVADSGKERRAYRVWADSNSDLARDLKNVMTEMVKARPPGDSPGGEFAGVSSAELLATAEAMIRDFRTLIETPTALPMMVPDAALPSSETRAQNSSVYSRSPTAPEAAAAVRTTGPGLDPPSDSVVSSRPSPSPEPPPDDSPVYHVYGRRLQEATVRECLRDSGDLEAYECGRISKAEAYRLASIWWRNSMELPR